MATNAGMARIMFTATLAVAASRVAAQDVDKEVNLVKAEEELSTLRNIVSRHKPAAMEAAIAEANLKSKLEQLGTQRSFVGDPDGAMAAFDELFALDQRKYSRSADDFDRLAASQPQNAVEAIVREARTHRIVILNEAHHVPLHRGFAMKLARELRKIGYTWLACETFEAIPFRKGYLSLSDGYYSREPMFGHFLRDAASDGWKMVQYEPLDDAEVSDPARQIDMREQGQARNLAERVFNRDPEAKLLIFVGYGHLTERPRAGDGSGPAMMAAYLKAFTGLDPLTIDQTTMTAHTTVKAEHPMYGVAVAREQSSAPFVLRAPGGGYEVFGGYRFAVDMQVTHPRFAVDSITQRPTWMSTLAELRPVDVPRALLPSRGSQLIYAYDKQASADAVPADIIKVDAGVTPPKFMMPKGDYRYVVRPYGRSR